jgi:hypothetical protein
VRWRSDDTVNKDPKGIPDIKPMFQNNVGITSQIFTKDHPFISEIGAEQAHKIRAQAETETMRWERSFILQLAKENLVGKRVQAAGEKLVTFSGAGIKEAINQPHQYLLDKNRAILNIQSLLKKASYLGAMPSQSRDLNIKFFHYWSTIIDAKTSYIIAKEMYSGEIVFYSIVDEMKKF